MATVRQVAAYLGVSTTRVRQLLLAGRIVADKDDTGHWRISYPPTIRHGARGPKLGRAMTKRSIRQIARAPSPERK